MSRKRAELDRKGQAKEALSLLKKEPAGWRRERLQALKLGFDLSNSLESIAQSVGRSRATIQTWFETYRKGGLEALLKKESGKGQAPALNEKEMAAFKTELDKAQWRTGGQAYRWLQEEFGVSFHPQRIYVYLKKLGGRLKVPRPSHRKKDPQKGKDFQENLHKKIESLNLPKKSPLRLWIYDEARYGLAPVTRKMWTSKGTEIIAPVHHRYEWGYVFGALQIGGGGSEFLLSPTVSKEADKTFLRQISHRDPGAIHVVIGDGAGFHHRDKGKGSEALPDNIRLLTLPPYSPELNPVEKLWDLMKDAICNKVFDTLEELEGHITDFLRPYWQDARKVFSLIADGYLLSKLNAISSKQKYQFK